MATETDPEAATKSQALDFTTVKLKNDPSESNVPESIPTESIVDDSNNETKEIGSGKTDSFGGITKVKKGKALHKRSVYIIYLIITFAFGCIQSYPSTLITHFEEQIDSSHQSDIQWLFAVRSLGYMLSTIFVGIQLDFFNNTHYFASITLIAAIVPFIFMHTIKSFSWFILFWFIIGFVTGTLEVSVPVYIWRLYATSASARYTTTGIASGVGGTLMPLAIQLSLHLFDSYSIASWLLAFILAISAFFLIVWKTPKHDAVVKKIKRVKRANLKRIATLRNRQKQLQSTRHLSLPEDTSIAYGMDLYIDNTQNRNAGGSIVDQQDRKRGESIPRVNAFELLKRTFTEILISDDDLIDANDDNDMNLHLNIFDIEDNQDAAELGMDGIFNPILLHEIQEANEHAGIDDIIKTPRYSHQRENHSRLKSMLSVGIDNVDDLDVINYDFSNWVTPRADLPTMDNTQSGNSSINENKADEHKKENNNNEDNGDTKNKEDKTVKFADENSNSEPKTKGVRFRFSNAENMSPPKMDKNLSVQYSGPDGVQIPATPAPYQHPDDIEDEHWFGVERVLTRMMTKVHNKGKSRRNLHEYVSMRNIQSLRTIQQPQHTRPHGDSLTVPSDYKRGSASRKSSDSQANWDAMKEGLKRVRYKQEVIVLCIILMLFAYGWQTVLLANIMAYTGDDHVGRYLISLYSFSKYMSRFFLLLFSFPKSVSLQQITLGHLGLLLFTSFLFWILSYLNIYKYDTNYIYLYFLFFGFGVFGACVKTAIFSICKKIQPISGFVASVFLVAKCLGDGILPWIVAKGIQYFDYSVYEYVIGYIPIIMLSSWICIIILFKWYSESKRRAISHLSMQMSVWKQQKSKLSSKDLQSEKSS